MDKDLLSFTDHMIIDLVDPQAKVLDLGCGDGRLLHALAHKKEAQVQGVEISEEAIYQCVEKGISVYQADIDQGLSNFDDLNFDYVILNATLQVIHKPYKVIEEMLRVGRFAIISISNFGYVSNRLRVLCTGRVSDHIRLTGDWHDTPVIRFVSVEEFSSSLETMGIAVMDARFFLPLGRITKHPLFKDLLVKEALFKLRRN